jgi:hypothetical protein
MTEDNPSGGTALKLIIWHHDIQYNDDQHKMGLFATLNINDSWHI